MDFLLQMAAENNRLKASFSCDNTWLEMEMENLNTPVKTPSSITFRVTAVIDSTKWLLSIKNTPAEAVDDIMRKAGITTVQQYIDLKAAQ